MAKRHIIKRYIQKNYIIYIVSAIVFVTAVVLGASSSLSVGGEKTSELTKVCDAIFSKDFTCDYKLMAKRCIIDNLKIILPCFVLSLLPFTSFFCMAPVAFKGFAAGFTSGFVILKYKTKGLMYILMYIVPGYVFLLPVLFFMCSLCISFAFSYKNSKEGVTPFFAVMFIIYLLLTVLEICGGFFSSLLLKNF